MALAKTVTVFEVYDRAKTGPKVDEKEWDMKIIPQTATKLKKKYDIKMDKKTIIPTDKELMNNLFKAGLEMLVECGIYCIDTHRVIKYTEAEVLASIAVAPSSAVYGEGKNAVLLAPRSYKASHSPIIQGGPRSGQFCPVCRNSCRAGFPVPIRPSYLFPSWPGCFSPCPAYLGQNTNSKPL